jgi:Flp pilus assembly protein TadD
MLLRGQVVRLTRNGRYAEAEVVSREWVRLEPLDTDGWNEVAVCVWKQGRREEATSIFRHALQIDGQNEALWTNFGHMLSTMGRNSDAIEAYRGAIEQGPESFDAIMGSGVALSNLWKPREAVPYLEGALRLRPESPRALLNFGMNLGRMGRWHDAIACYENALRRGCDLLVLHRNLGVAYLMVGDYAKGWPDYEWRRTFNANLGCRVNRTFWNGDEFRNQTILLHFEQGLGDTLQFIRYAPLVKRRGGRVVVLCPGPMHSLLARCDGVDEVYGGSGPAPECHIQAPLVSLPSIFGTTLETIPTKIPYLHPEPASVSHWRGVLDDALAAEMIGLERRPFLIGIVWQGRAENATDHIRSFPPLSSSASPMFPASAWSTCKSARAWNRSPRLVDDSRSSISPAAPAETSTRRPPS